MLLEGKNDKSSLERRARRWNCRRGKRLQKGQERGKDGKERENTGHPKEKAIQRSNCVRLKEEDESVPFTAASPIFLLFSPLIHTQPAAYGRECPVRITQKTCGFLI